MSVPLRHAHRPAATGITLSFLAFLAGMAVPARAEVLRFHSPTHPVPVAAATARVWAVDRDRDGDDDLLIEDRATGQLAWIESLGQWQFGLPSALGVVAPRALLFVPADHGGAVDLVGVDELGRLTSRDVRRNGLPGSPHPLRPESFGPLLAIADLDADGRSEIVGIDASGSILIVLGRRAGPGWFVRHEIPVGSGIAALAVGDLDGDRRDEIAVLRPAAGLLHIVRRSSGGDFVIEESRVPSTTHELAFGDCDGDGATDVVTTHDYAYGAEPGVGFRYGTGDGRLAAEVDFPTPYQGLKHRMSVGDLDGDGAAEVVLPELGMLSHVGRARPPIKRSIIPFGEASDCAIGDFDGDGARDVALGSLARFGGSPETRWFSGYQVRFVPGEGNRFPLVLPRFVYEASSFTPGLVADLDGDGEDDVAAAIGDQLVIQLSRGRGREPDVMRSTLPWTTSGTRLLAGDLDGDGKVDLVASAQRLDFAAALGHGDGTFSPWVLTPAPAGVDQAILADLDQDGREDFVGEDRFPADVHALRILRGLGNGGFATWTLLSAPGEVVDLAAARGGDGSMRVAVLQVMPTALREPPWSALQVLSTGPAGSFGWSGIHRFERGAHAVRPIVLAGSDDPDWIVMGTSLVPPWTTWVFPGWLVRTTSDGSRTLDSLDAGELMLKPPAIADFDGDGSEDVAYSVDHAEFDIVRGTRHGLDPERIRVGAPDFTWPLAGDFDGDGRTDVVALRHGRLTWLWNEATAPPNRQQDSRIELARDAGARDTSTPGSGPDGGFSLRIGGGREGGSTIFLASSRAIGPLRLDAFDVRGRQVVAADLGSFTPGEHRISMDGISPGRAIPAGLYFVRIQVGGVDHTVRWVRL